MSSSNVQAAKWPTGPPAPYLATVLARLLEVSTFIVTVVWVFHNLGGLKVQPEVKGPGTNDTGALFNWHPILMSLGFAVFMSEAVLAYSHPPTQSLNRSQRKILHASMHTAAIVCIIIAIIATFKSHTLKLPTPTPNLYSPHSYLGMLTFVLSLAQYLAGLLSFLVPQVPHSQRAAYSPLHMYFGRATYVLGLATMTVGIQEKTTFVQQMKSLSGAALFSDNFKLPAALNLLIAFTGLLVLYHHVPDTTAKQSYDDGGLLEEGSELHS